MLTNSTTPSEMDVEQNTANTEIEKPQVQNNGTTEVINEEEALKKAWKELDVDKDMDRYFNDGPVDSTTDGNEVSEDAPSDQHVDSKPEGNDEQANDMGSKKGFYIDDPTLKFKGHDVPVSSADEMKALAQKGIRVELTMQKLKHLQKFGDIIESAGLEESEIQALADAKGGKTEAFEYLGKKFGIDVVKKDVDDIFGTTAEVENKPSGGSQYKPDVKPSDPVKAIWEEFTASNPQLASKVLNIYNGLEDTFKSEIYNSTALPAFIEAVEMGEFEKAYPIAVKVKAMNPALGWRQAYASAVQSMISEQPVESKPSNPPAQAGIQKGFKEESGPRKEKDIRYKIWHDKSYEDELMSKLFN